MKYKKNFRKTSLKQEGIGEHMNFFEGRSTEYSKASTQGSWTEAFS